MKMKNVFDEKYIKYSYICIYFVSILLMLGVLHEVIESSFPRGDSWWAVPNVFQHIEGKSIGNILKFIFSQSPYTHEIRVSCGELYTKLYMAITIYLFGPSANNFIYISIFVHIINSILLFFLSKNIGFDAKISFFASLLYLTLFAHFDAYLWPIAFQHLIVGFFILLTLNLYLVTNELLNEGKEFNKYYIVTIMTCLAASFCRQSILMLPASIFCHVIFSSKNDTERINKYKIWLPLFLIFLIYPLLRLTYVYDHQLSVFLSRIGLPTDYSLILMICLALLIIVWIVLYISQKYLLWNKIKWIFIIIIAGLFLLFVKNEAKIILLPYISLIPYSYALNSLIDPFNIILIRPSSVPHYHIQLAVNIFDYIIGLTFIIVFLKKYVNLWKNLIVLIIPYLFIIIYSPTFLIPSRYFTYISPLFCISFSAVMFFLFEIFADKVKLNKTIGYLLLTGIFFLLCIQNLIAMKYMLVRGQLPNSFYVYDDIRTAEIIRNDIKKYNININSENIYIKDVLPLSYQEIWDFYPSDIDPNEYHNLRFAFTQVFRDNSMLKINVNKDPIGKGNYYEYTLNEDRIIDSNGNNIEQFSNIFEEGIRMMSLNKNENAIELFRKAFFIKPFLMQYVLKDYDLQDLFFITNGIGMNEWVKQIMSYYSSAYYFTVDNQMPPKGQFISKIMEKEINDFMQCVFYLSYLEFKGGNIEKSKKYFTQLQYLETDSENLYYELSKIKNIEENTNMMSFLKKFNFDLSNNVIYKEQSQQTYRFIRFIMKLFFKIKLGNDYQ